MKKRIVILLLLFALALSACGNSLMANQEESSATANQVDYSCYEPELSMSYDYLTFEEALSASTNVVVAKFVERRPFGSMMEELEFEVSEWIFGETAERIFVYINKHDLSIMGGGVTDFVEYEVEFETGVNYLLSLRVIDIVISNFHEDGYYFVTGSPVVNLNNPIESTMYNEPIMFHSEELDFRRRNLSETDIVSFAEDITSDNIPAAERDYIRKTIRSADVEEVVNRSENIAVIEVNELTTSFRSCSISSDRHIVTVADSLKGNFEIGYEFELGFFPDTVRIGEQYIVTIRKSGASPHPDTGIMLHFLTSRHGVFELYQRDEIVEILEIYSESNVENEHGYEKELVEDRTINIDTILHRNIEELKDRATHIIRGDVLDQRIEWINPTIPREVVERLSGGEYLTEDEIEEVTLEKSRELVTISSIRILESFHGDHHVGDIIEVMQLGGEYGNEHWLVEGTLELELDSELVLFLVS